MPAPILQLRSRVSNPDVFRGKLVTEGDVAVKLEGDADVYKPDGQPLCMLRRGGIPAELCAQAYPALHELRNHKTNNRGAYAGATRTSPVFADGTKSKNSYTRTPDGKVYSVASAIIGYFDRQGGRFPFCRETAFTGKEPEQWKTVLPIIEHAALLFKQAAPKRYATQLAECKKCPPEYIIGETPFTTLTVNNNVAPAAAHTDKGDFKDGLGLISVVRRGTYSGAWLVFPEYRVGADLRDGDAIFFNSHDWHGVTAMVSQSPDAERISVVYYFREKMVDCLPLKEELARAKSLGGLEVEEADEA